MKELKEAATLSNEEISELIPDLDFIIDWCGKVKDEAVKRLLDKKGSIPNYKLITTAGRTKITNENSVIDNAIKLGYKIEDITTTELKGLTELKKLFGTKHYSEIINGSNSTVSIGKPKLVTLDTNGKEYTSDVVSGETIQNIENI